MQFTTIKNEIENITTEQAATKRIIREYYERLCAHKLDNLKEIDQFLKNHKPLKVIQDEIRNLNSPITVK